MRFAPKTTTWLRTCVEIFTKSSFSDQV